MPFAGGAALVSYRKSAEASAADLAIMAMIDRQYLAPPIMVRAGWRHRLASAQATIRRCASL
jgi:hypothetical protein